MISQTEFDRVASEILRDVNAMMTKMQTYKKHLQYEVLKYATTEELVDVKYCKYNDNLVKKLIALAGEEYSDDCGGLKSLYSASMAVATIIKEYGWGTRFLTPDGLYEMANLISNSLLRHSDVLNDGNLKMKNPAYEIELYTHFLARTEDEIKTVGFMGIPIRSLRKISYPHNMIGISIMICQTQKFLLFIDNDYGRLVVTQRTYWGKDVNTAYELFAQDKALIIDGKPKYFDTDGYMIKSSKFNRVLVERGIDDNELYIATSINV